MIRSRVFWLSFLITLVLALFLARRIERPIPGAIKIKLLAGCQIELLDTRLQPVFTVVLACPRVDGIRLFPLPVIQPFYEDWYEQPGVEAKSGTKVDILQPYQMTWSLY